MGFEPGSRVGPFEIIGDLGAGGMGAVYRARDSRLKRDVAIKVLLEGVAADPDRLARFQREAEALAAMNHPNIAAIYGIEGGALILELVEGPTLADRLAQGKLAPSDALPVVHQLIDALEYAHEKGIVHRDLKPANIKLTPDGRLKVLDFGLAMALSNESGPAPNPATSPTLTLRATMAGTILGTAGYMSPEQARGQQVDKRADIWAFGAVVYEMVTGQQLFAGPTVSDSLAAVLTREPDLSRVPPELRRLVAQCLMKDSRRRLRDIGDARILLAETPAEPALAVTPVGRASRLPWAVAVAGLLAAAALGIYVLRHPVEIPHAVRLTMPLPDKVATAAMPPTLSPDGMHLAFVAISDGAARVWLRDMDASTARPLEGTDGVVIYSGLFWSPDSRYLGFFASGKLKKLAIAGGPAISLCDATQARGGSWSTRDVIIFTPNIGSALMRVPAAGGTPVPATELDQSRGENTHRWPWFLPDGRHFLYLGRSSDAERSSLWVGDLESKSRKRLMAGLSNAVYDPRGYLLFLRERVLMAQPFDAARLELSGEAAPVAAGVDYNASPYTVGNFSVSQTGTLGYFSGSATAASQFTWYTRDGKIAGAAGAPFRGNSVSLSPDGRFAATERTDPQTAGRYDIWISDLIHSTDRKLTVEGKDCLEPVWSPDGKYIAYYERNSNKDTLCIRAADGSGNEDRLLEVSGTALPTSWSRDGKYLLFNRTDRPNKPDIWLVENPLDPSHRTVRAHLATEFVENNGSLSPDGKWLAYMSDLAGQTSLYVQSFPDKEGRWQVAADATRIPVWSKDGKELFYLDRAGQVVSVPVTAGATWQAGAPRVLFRTRNSGSFAVQADGKRFLVLDYLGGADVGTLNVVLNWPSTLK